MSESQSRYSIVERLTNIKLKIMDSKLVIADEIELKSLERDKKDHELEVWKNSMAEQVKREESEKTQEIEFLKQEYDHLVASKQNKEKSLEKKLFEVDNALKSIQAISKAATAQAKV